MSMQSLGSSGYVVPLVSLRPLLSEEDRKEFDALIDDEDGDSEALYDFLERALPEYVPPFDLYKPADEDEVDEPLKVGEYAAIFADSDLYVKQPTEGLKALGGEGIVPAFQSWSVWC